MNDKIREKVDELNALLLEEHHRSGKELKLVLTMGSPGQKIEALVSQNGILQEMLGEIITVARNAAADALSSTTSHLKPVIRPRFASRPQSEYASLGGD